MFNRLFISYKVQSIVVCVSILLLWIWICLNKYFNPQPEVKAFGGDGFVCVAWGLYFEIIIIPINSLYIELINRIKYNRVKICTNKSIALFMVMYEFLYVLLIFIDEIRGFVLFMLYSILSMIIFFLNCFIYLRGKTTEKQYTTRPAEFPNSAASLYREFATRIVAVRQKVIVKLMFFQRWEFLRPFGSK